MAFVQGRNMFKTYLKYKNTKYFEKPKHVSCVDFRNKITYLLRMVVIQSMITKYFVLYNIT
jgi:hypothetical protein